jgi:hypothetical protein
VFAWTRLQRKRLRRRRQRQTLQTHRCAASESKIFVDDQQTQHLCRSGKPEHQLLCPQGGKSVFHGKKDKDYAGRSWLEKPKGLKPENEYCYLPKRWIHTWSGHTKVGAQASGNVVAGKKCIGWAACLRLPIMEPCTSYVSTCC